MDTTTPIDQRLPDDDDGPEEPHGHSVPEPRHPVNYYAIFGLLVMLTVVTIGVAFVHLRSELAKVIVALLIASIKAAFVALYFMHLKFEGKLIYLILLLPVFLCIVLVIALIPDIVHAKLFVDFAHMVRP
jgi:cytochrome c oxidase subunit 4